MENIDGKRLHAKTASPMDNNERMPQSAGRLGDFEGNLGDYVIKEKIAEGGIGEIYIVTTKNGLEKLVLKVLRRDQAGSAMANTRFLTEIDGCSRISHPNIIRAIDKGNINGMHYYVMPFISGKTLKELLQSGYLFSADDAMTLMETVARALGHVHRAGIIHCDIKPDNIMVTTDGKPVVIDFGLSVDLYQVKQHPNRVNQPTGYIIGTPNYMAPEQIQGTAAEIGPAVDVYAMGAVLFELLCGRPPFQIKRNDDVMTLLDMVLNQEPPSMLSLAQDVSPELNQVVMKCLAKSAQKRYHSADDLAVALNNVRRGVTFRKPSRGLFRKLTGFFYKNTLKKIKNDGGDSG